ncbi:MAG: serine/threonine protein kinase, partial [Myxococcaceae bacterium]|nr:serine/threonine protein kinase [Myxococcaceae bacterium]
MSLAACQHCGAPLVVGAVGCDRCGRYLSGDELSRGTGAGAVQTQLGTRVRAALLEGRYRLVEPIAVGRSSTVWRAHDTALDRPVAVKVLDEASARSPEAVARFERRAQKLASVEHPAVVPVLAAGTAEPNPFLVMPLIAGVTLAEHLHASGGALSPPAVAELVGTLCEAFAVLHATEHREAGLELRHVLVNAAGQPTLLDAGLEGSSRGSAGALAPKLASGGRPGPRSDVYALAAVAVELLRGHPLAG